ncbi:uncharacterized protein BDCG_17404 [Blastomyces dermatitidis ER-3]|uniref:Uncharacterized protein n=1 Tax=Ajellomyces dermatitidis (strain ER-3 / ATCC MYA-2586) TaxID=559297 RepID=A0ABX2VYB5_AJEDR|nr:uncharacterized protein BDCG_17404 [Blastomyces dermatitidis ER-3]OAT02144.1 hypothetical protein BDCG_17404 [Blastomyces dermatitidis ER-3]
MASCTCTEINPTSFSEENTTSFPREFKISESAAHFDMSSLTALSSPQPLHIYIYHGDREIKVRDSSRYKRNILSEFHSFIHTLEQKFHLNLSQYNTHEI